MLSASGGVFSTIAEEVIKHGGVVFGASYSDSFHSIKHIGIDDIEMIDLLRGSKYSHSKMNKAYSETLKHLNAGKIVFYSGLPCQIAGLYKYLKLQFDNLFTCSLICHGVPTTKLYESYVNYLEDLSSSKLKKLNFRSKIAGWDRSSVVAEFENGRIYRRKLNYDPYMIAYSSGLMLRACCSRCKFKRIEQVSDLTIGDFWGAKKEYPTFFDNKGISAVIINSPKGSKLIKNTAHLFDMICTDIKVIDKHNPRLTTASKINDRTIEFEADLEKYGFLFVKNKYLLPPPIWKGSLKFTLIYWSYSLFLRLKRTLLNS